MQRLCRFILRCIGWKIVGELPATKKFILIVAPHTSNWDLVIGLLGRYSVGGKFYFFAKHQVFFFPLGQLLKAMGGIPLDRTVHHNFVERVVQMYKEKDEFVIGLAPEGTRSPVKRWKTGFYYIAEQAKIPIALIGFDYPKKEIIIREPFFTSGDIEKDFKEMLTFFRTIHGKRPKEIPDFKKEDK